MEKLRPTSTHPTLFNLFVLTIFFITTAHFNIDKTFYHWTGQESTEWHNANNWKDGAVPDSNSNVYIPHTDQFPILDGLVQVNYLKIDTGAKLRVAISGILTIKYLINEGLLFGNGTLDGLLTGSKIDNYGIIDGRIIGDGIEVTDSGDGWSASFEQQKTLPPSDLMHLVDDSYDQGDLLPTND